ncbi:MAG: Flp family type IVb pilin [Sphingomonadales bacterium]|jgi:pilus assembly protein Flp/PilA
MLTFKNLVLLHKFGRDETAATAIEYGLMVALIVIAMIVGLNSFATSFVNMYDYVVKTIEPVLS